MDDPCTYGTPNFFFEVSNNHFNGGSRRGRRGGIHTPFPSVLSTPMIELL